MSCACPRVTLSKIHLGEVSGLVLLYLESLGLMPAMTIPACEDVYIHVRQKMVDMVTSLIVIAQKQSDLKGVKEVVTNSAG